MSRLTPTDWRTLVRIFLADGFTQDRTTGSHVVLTKPGIDRPVIIPRYTDVGLARTTHQLSAADADPYTVADRTPSSRFDVVRLRLQRLAVRAARHSAVSAPSQRKLVSDVGLDIIRNNMRTAGMSRKRYLELLRGS